MLLNAQCDDEYSAQKMNPHIHLECELPAKVNAYRAECNLSDVDSHFFQNTYPCSFLEICRSYPEEVTKFLGFQKKKSNSKFKQN